MRGAGVHPLEEVLLRRLQHRSDGARTDLAFDPLEFAVVGAEAVRDADREDRLDALPLTAHPHHHPAPELGLVLEARHLRPFTSSVTSAAKRIAMAASWIASLRIFTRSRRF